MKKHLRTAVAIAILIVTAAAFAYYVKNHPETLDQLRGMPPTIIIVLLAINAVGFLSYMFVTRGSLRVYGKHLSLQENILFNAYSSLINFFGPGQSGPIFRGAYLKKRHDLPVKKFMFITLIYLAFYAIISAMFMLIGSRPWWQTAVVMLLVGAACFVLVRRYKQGSKIDTGHGLNPKTLGWILAATAVQVSSFAVLYGVELRQISPDVSVGQILSYTGVSNFTLFVALTPGAIGIREAFLVFSQNLHHINNTTIVAANILDRAVYLLFLGLLFIMVISLHAKDKLNISQLKLNTKQKDPS